MRYRFGSFELDTDRELLIGPEGPAVLRRQAYRLLRHLVERAPALVTRDELMDALWGHHALSPNVVPQTVSELRQALGDDAQQPRYVETRHRRGYRFVAEVERLDEPVESAANTALPDRAVPGLAEPALAVSAALTGSRKGSRVARLVIIAAIAIGLLGLALASREYAERGSGAATTTTEAPGPLWLDWSAGEPRLAAWLDLRGRSGANWRRWEPALAASGARIAPWTLGIDAEGRWTLADQQGHIRERGTLRDGEDPHDQAVGLLRALGSASGIAALHVDPVGWPVEPSARAALVQGAVARREGRLADAVTTLALASAAVDPPGWTQWFHAEALAEAGHRAAALEQLATLRKVSDRFLALRAEALRADLADRPAEALAAWRASTLLLPGDIGLRVALIDAQRRMAQWPAVAESLDDLGATLGDKSPALAWRRAEWLAAMHPGEADAAYRWAIDLSGPAAASVLREARMAYVDWLIRRGRWEDAQAQLDALPEDLAVRDRRAALAHARGALADARADYHGLSEAYGRLGQTGEQRRARLALAELSLQMGDAADTLAAAAALAQEAEREADSGLTVPLLDLEGRAHTSLGQFEAAAASLAEAIEVARSRGDVRAEARARFHLGNVHAQERQRPEAAEQAYRLAAEAFRSLRDDLWEAKALANQALMAEREGRRLDARAAYATALARMREYGAPHELGRIAFNAGVNERELGEIVAAASHLDEALAAFRQSGMAEGWLRVAATRADLALLAGEPARARQLLDESASLLADASPLPHSNWLTASARLAELGGDFATATARLEEADTLRRRTGIRVAELDLKLRQLRHRLVKGERVEFWAIERIHSELQRVGEPKYALAATLAMAQAELVAGDPKAARIRADALRAVAPQQGNRAQQLEIDWLLAWTATGVERTARLSALARDAADSGFGLLARLAEHEGSAADPSRQAEIARALTADGLGGALRSPAGAF